MGMTCSICSREDREQVDLAIVSGEPQRAIASRFGVSRAAVQRHAQRHVSPAIAAVHAERVEQGATSLLARVEHLIERTDKLLGDAEQNGRVTTALGAVRELRSLLELLGKASGELSTVPTVTINLMASEEYIAVRSAIFAALLQYPDARLAVASNLLELEAGPS